MWAFITTIAWLIILLPAGLLTLVWYRDPQRRPFPLAAWGVGLFLSSFCFISWLNLQPLKHFGLDWLYDIAPALEFLFKRLGREFLLEFLEKATSLELIFEPPGWITMAITARWYIWPFMMGLGSAVFLLAWPVALNSRYRWLGYPLTASSLLLLLSLIWNLPEIDGLGERTMPHITALAEPILGAHLLWRGPLTMVLGLLLLAIAGLNHTQTGSNRDDAYDGDDFQPISEDWML